MKTVLFLLAVLLPVFAFGNDSKHYFRLNEHYSPSYFDRRELAEILRTHSVLRRLSDVKIVSIERTAIQKFREWEPLVFILGSMDLVSAYITIEGKDQVNNPDETQRFSCKMVIGNFRDETQIVICPDRESSLRTVVLKGEDLGIYPSGINL